MRDVPAVPEAIAAAVDARSASGQACVGSPRPGWLAAAALALSATGMAVPRYCRSVSGALNTVTTRRGVAAAFQLPEDAHAEAPRIEAAPALCVMPSLLAMQEAGMETVADRSARRHGGQLLESLTALQRAMLANAGAAELDALEHLVRGAPAADDPRLAAVQRALVQRVAVELARRRAATSV